MVMKMKVPVELANIELQDPLSLLSNDKIPNPAKMDRIPKAA